MFKWKIQATVDSAHLTEVGDFQETHLSLCAEVEDFLLSQK